MGEMEIQDRMADLERRLEKLEAKDAIAVLAVRYGEVVDNRDAAGLRALFTDDARWHWANGVVDGRGIDQVMEVLAGRWDTIDSSLHVTHGHVIELDPDLPDQATGVLFSHAEVLRDGNAMISAVRYDDVYRSVDNTWRFSERKLSFFYYVNADSYTGDLVSGTPVRVGGSSVAADYPR